MASVVLVLRTYAIYYRNLWVLIITSLLGMSTVATAGWSLTELSGIVLSFGDISLYRTCLPAHLQSASPFKISWALSLLFDSSIFVLTVSKTWKMIRVGGRDGMHNRLPMLLMRDGSMFFAVMALANLTNLVVNIFAPDAFFTQSTGNNSVITHTLSVTLMSRLILDLRTLDDRSTTVSGNASFLPLVSRC